MTTRNRGIRIDTRFCFRCFRGQRLRARRRVPSWTWLRASLLGMLCLVGCGDRRNGADSGQAFPVRPVKLIVPFAAGGGSDTFARLIQNAINREHLLPEPLVIVNVPGAGGTIGSRRVKQARPDGYTLLLLHEGMMTAHRSGRTAYGVDDFAAVVGTGNATQVIAVPAESPYDSLAALMESATSKEEPIVFAANIGAPSHFAGLMLESRCPGASFRFTQIGGGAKRFAALQGRHADVSTFSIAEYVQFRPSGLRALAILSERRHPDFPEVKTADEQGFDVVSENMQFWWAPPGTPAERIDVIAAAVTAAMQTDPVRQRLSEMKMTDVILRGDELKREIRDRDDRIALVAPDVEIDLPDFPAIVIGWVLLTGIIVVFGRPRPQQVDSSSEKRASMAGAKPPPAWGILAVVMAATITYVGALQSGRVGYVAATLVFTALCGGAISFGDSQWKSKPAAVAAAILATAVTMSFAVHFVFTQWLVVDLP